MVLLLWDNLHATTALFFDEKAAEITFRVLKISADITLDGSADKQSISYNLVQVFLCFESYKYTFS